MPTLVHLRLVGFALGTLLHLFLLVLVVGYRRPRAFERVLFFLALSLFLFYSGALLALNAQIYYPNPPPGTLTFAVMLVAGGLGFLPPLLVHLHAAYMATLRDTPSPAWLNVPVVAAYLPIAYFGPFAFPRLMESPPLEFLWPGSRIGSYYGIWLGAAVLAGAAFNLSFARHAADPMQRQFHRALACFFGVAAALATYTYALGGPRDPAWSAALATAVMLSSLVPSSLLGYFILRYNFLQIGTQRNLVYAVSAAFLALLYLAVVRRVETWLEPVVPPDATASILLFVLVVFFEPLQRSVGRALHRTFRREVDRLQRLTADLQQEARRGELDALLRFAEGRIRDEYDLAIVRVFVAGGPGAEALRPPGVSGHAVRIRLGKEHERIGMLEACSSGAAISGDRFAALEFLAEQLPAMIDLCRLIEQKLALERELAERERLALVGQMAARISHNLKNPLGSMKTVLQVQLENPELPERVHQDCAMVVSEIDRLSARLSQLLRYAKPSVRGGGAPQRVAAVALTEQLVALLGREAERRQVRLELKREAGETFVPCTEDALGDVLSNLVVNAIEVLPPGGSVRVRLARHGANLVVEVTDDSPGIPGELRPKIFQPFFSTKPSGTGLGLAVVQRRLAEMEGTVSWESPVQNGRGTRFTVTLPVAE